MFCQIVQKKREEKRIEEEQVAKVQNWKLPICCDDDDDYNSAITPNKPVDSLSIGDEHLNTISATESDKFIKSRVENLVPNPKIVIRQLISSSTGMTFSPSPIPDEDSDSRMEEIDLTCTPYDPMPSSIEDDDDDSKRDILIHEELFDNYSLSLPEIKSFYFDIPSIPGNLKTLAKGFYPPSLYFLSFNWESSSSKGGKIRTGKLDFKDVFFVKELKFNLFSVLHMCDKKNSVLFTKTECLILSPDFKLPDENQVLLKNMVLETKHHNKTPYELLIGRAPVISFMRPFGYPVTILNTLDHLGKFDGKANEGFLVGYSINSKAFRVYNSRTKKVEENLHVNFLENKPNVVGSGSKIHSDVGQDGKEKVSNQEYILLPVLNTSSDVPSCNEEVESSPKYDADGSENTNSTNSFNIASLTVNTASDKDGTFQRTYGEWNFSTPIPVNVNAVGSSFSHPAALDDFFKMPNLEDTGIFDDAYDDRDEGVEADYNNLETIIPGHKQEEVIDYDEVFAPVARIKAIRLFLAYASFMDFIVYQMDVKSAFLYGTIKEEPNEPPLIEGHTSESREDRLEENIELTDTLPTPYDSPLTGCYTPRSDEGRITLAESMETFIILSNRVTQLETELSTTKAVYNKTFITLTNKVKNLESQLKQKRKMDKDENINLVSEQGEVQETTEHSRDDDETLVETMLNIKRSSAKDKGKGIMQETELPKKLKKK
nr:ribonuclease H-like domain-containing protein [Tanacetum cinerariifolium]